MKLYKIRNEEGLYSSGGSRPDWTKKGKTWSNIGYIKNHIHQISDRDISIYDNAVIVEIEIKEEEFFTYPVIDLIKSMKDKEAEFLKYFYEVEMKHVREHELKLLAELKSKYER